MTENIADALRFAVDLSEYSEKIVTDKDGKEFYDRDKLTLVELNPKRYPKTLHLSSLTSLIDYLKSDLNDLSKQNLIVVVEDNKTVVVYSENDELENRVELVRVSARLPEITFERFMSSEKFNIMLQASFINDADRDLLISSASSLKIDKGAEIIDNGVSQIATVKSGVASVAQAKMPNPVNLRPYRTFAEVEQPLSQFVFRIDEHANLGLFEADGRRWISNAVQNVAQYLIDNLCSKENITVLY
ncbi:TPA: hypothetical protein U4W96_000179 [Streptococcus agalactiae]|uniref:hypothetical protein n=1 Tax=Streptococcus agalactiae TaxID=1311 RepID=UPI000D6FA0E0|nr:hypothetical protein [Streptococcus agalactiae]PWT25387.1 hypothetical protein CUZ34_01280 [Streptococcus agalactiae]HEN3143877.1 hypothetical protein [Streptococcus agalactiae]